jgi:hypothetical protein
MSLVPVASDDANRANGAIGSNYTIPSGVNAPVISNNVFQKGSGRCGALWTADSFEDDQYAAVTLTLVHNCASNSSGDSLGGGIGVALRGASGGDGYFVCGANNRTIVVARISGVDTVLYDDTPSWSDGDVLRAQVVGSTITVFRNDTQVAEVDASESAIASGHAGMFFLGGNFGTLRLDDWSAGTVTTGANDIAYRSAAATASTTTATKPTGVQSGDLVLALIGTARPDAAPIAPTAPEGWTYVENSNLTFDTGAGFWQGTALFWAYHSDTLSYTFTLDPNKGGEHFALVALSDPAESDPIQGVWQQLFTTATTDFAVTPDATDRSAMMAVLFADGRVANWLPPSGFIERLQANNGCIDTMALAAAGDGGAEVSATPSASSLGAVYVLLVYGASSASPFVPSPIPRILLSQGNF